MLWAEAGCFRVTELALVAARGRTQLCRLGCKQPALHSEGMWGPTSASGSPRLQAGLDARLSGPCELGGVALSLESSPLTVSEPMDRYTPGLLVLLNGKGAETKAKMVGERSLCCVAQKEK